MIDNSLLKVISDNKLKGLGRNCFRGSVSDNERARVYGGQIIAQAISAAQQTVSEGFIINSCSSYFIRSGDPLLSIDYKVDDVRGGRSISTRGVVASQGGKEIFRCTVSFHLLEKGISHQIDMPEVARPDELVCDEDLLKNTMSFEFRQVDPVNLSEPEPTKPIGYAWFKAKGAIGSDARVHEQLLAYASDTYILLTALRPHGVSYLSPGTMIATIEHSIWFHQPCHVDDWLLYETFSDFTGNGRGLCHGRIFDIEGNVIATVMQEGLLRCK